MLWVVNITRLCDISMFWQAFPQKTLSGWNGKSLCFYYLCKIWIDATRRVSKYSVDTVEIWYSPPICNNEVQCSSAVQLYAEPRSTESCIQVIPESVFMTETSAVSPCLPLLFSYNEHRLCSAQCTNTVHSTMQCTAQCSAYIITDPEGGRGLTHAKA